MARWQLITVIIVLYLAVTLGIGLRAGRKASKSVTGYVAGDRSFGLLVMYFIFGATMFSAFAFLGGPGWAYSRGAAAFYILSYGILGMAPWYWVGPRAARVGRKYGYVTQAQLLVGRFPSRFLTALMAVLTVLAFIPYITLQMRGAGIVIEAVTDGHIPLWLGAGVAYGIVIIYVLSCGVAAVGWTNTFQGIFMLVIAWTLGIYLPMRLYGGVGAMFQEIAAQRPELLTAPGPHGHGRGVELGRLFHRDPGERHRGVHVAPPLHEGFRGQRRRHHPEDRGPLPHLPALPHSRLPHRIRRSALSRVPGGTGLHPSLPDSRGAISLPWWWACSAPGPSRPPCPRGMPSFTQVRLWRWRTAFGPSWGWTTASRRRLMRWLVLAMGAIAYFFALYEGVSLVVLLLKLLRDHRPVHPPPHFGPLLEAGHDSRNRQRAPGRAPP